MDLSFKCLISTSCLCDLTRPPGPAQCEAHRAASGDGASFSGAAAEAKPSGLSAAVRQAAAEDDGPASDRHRSRPPHPAAEEDRGRHMFAPAAAGDHEGLVLELRSTRLQKGLKRKYSAVQKF